MLENLAIRCDIVVWDAVIPDAIKSAIY